MPLQLCSNTSTDDTLIILHACEEGAVRLRLILDQFAEAMGPRINFTKSTLAPVHVVPAVHELVVRALGCAVGSFPQPYLGLPLSWEKLRFADFLPMIAKLDKVYGWLGVTSPLACGRLVPINAALDALPTYAMAALLLPPALTRLWNVAERVSGAQCLVVWYRV
ncbi:hypothetical protein D1007_06152 [Hordeum vulgare]|nr:hypothetical protein D1007_06152 [Hordeum vulgare]